MNNFSYPCVSTYCRLSENKYHRSQHITEVEHLNSGLERSIAVLYACMCVNWTCFYSGYSRKGGNSLGSNGVHTKRQKNRPFQNKLLFD